MPGTYLTSAFALIRGGAASGNRTPDLLKARAGDHNPPRRRHVGTRWRQAWLANGTIADLAVVCARDTQDGQGKVFVAETPADGYEASVITGEVSLQWRVPAGEGVTELHPGLA